MLQKIKTLIASLALLFMLALPFAVPASVSAECSPGSTGSSNCITGGLCKGVETFDITTGVTTCKQDTTGGISDLVKKVINILSVVVGIVAVIMIIIGGLRYITSGGSTEKVTGAKNTILYALIGLVIVALAQVIVRFVLNKISSSTT